MLEMQFKVQLKIRFNKNKECSKRGIHSMQKDGLVDAW